MFVSTQTIFILRITEKLVTFITHVITYHNNKCKLKIIYFVENISWRISNANLLRRFAWIFKQPNIPLLTPTIALNYKRRILYSLSITVDPHQLHKDLFSMVLGSLPRNTRLVNLFKCIVYWPAENFNLNFASNSCFFFVGRL